METITLLSVVLAACIFTPVVALLLRALYNLRH